MHYFLCLLHTGGNEHPAVGVWLYLLPRELPDVALPQSRKTGEKKRQGGYPKRKNLLEKPLFPIKKRVILAFTRFVYSVMPRREAVPK